MADKRFTWMHSGQVGAPQMNGAAGSNGQMLQVLDACLIDGFNPQTAISASKTATSVTLVYGVAHGYELSQDVMVTGASDSNLNGRHRVMAKTDTSLTISAAGVTSVAGTIVTKVAPLGFESIFGSIDPLKRAYRSKDIQSSRTVLYLDMSLPTGHGYNTTNPVKRAMVDMCENMTVLGTQINSYTSAYNNKPTVRNGKMLWYQCREATKNQAVTRADSTDWVIVGSDTFFYIFNDFRGFLSSDLRRDNYFFGDMFTLSGVATPSNCGWLGAVNPNDTDNRSAAFIGGTIGGSATLVEQTKGFMIKSANGSGALNPLVLSIDGTERIVGSGLEGLDTHFPNPASQSILGLPIYALTAQHLRAKLPLLHFIPQNMSSNVVDFDKLVAGNSLTVSVETISGIGFLSLFLGA